MSHSADMNMDALISELELDEGVRLSPYRCTAGFLTIGVGRNLDTRKPLLDARLPDGSRVNVVAHPLSLDGTAISIRKFARAGITLDTMAEWGNSSPQLSERQINHDKKDNDDFRLFWLLNISDL